MCALKNKLIRKRVVHDTVVQKMSKEALCASSDITCPNPPTTRAPLPSQSIIPDEYHTSSILSALNQKVRHRKVSYTLASRRSDNSLRFSEVVES